MMYLWWNILWRNEGMERNECVHFLNENEKQIHQGRGDVGMADFVPFIHLEKRKHYRN